MKRLIFPTYLLDLPEFLLVTGPVFQRWNKNGRFQRAEQSEALLDQMHKTSETGVVVRETHRHQDIANDIGDGNRENWVKIDGVVSLRLQHAQELLHLLHDAFLHQSLAVAEESHAEEAETIVEESPLFLPHFAGSVNHACI